MRRYQVVWSVSIYIVSIIFFLLLTAVLLMSPTARADETTPVHLSATGTVSVQTTPTLQVTPTVDPTMTVLEKKKLMEEVDPSYNWLLNNLATILAPILTGLAIVGGAYLGFRQWLDDHSIDRMKRDEDRFQFAVRELGGDKPGQKIGGAVMLHTFLVPEDKKYGYKKFYIQIFDLAVANLRLKENSTQENNLDISESPNSLIQALSVLFKEAFPIARTECINKSKDKKDKQPSQQEVKSNQALIIVSKSVPGQPIEKPSEDRLADFEAKLLDATGVLLNKTYLNDADLRKAYLRFAHLEGAHLESALLEGADLEGADLEGADLEGAHLGKNDDLDLEGACLKNAILKGAHLKGADLKGANLKGADLEDADLEDADLRKATYEVEKLIKANLKKVDLGGEDLTEKTFIKDGKGIDLTGIQLENAILSDAYFKGANLAKANLKGADLKGTNFQGANLTGANFEGAINYENSIWKEATLVGVIGLPPEFLCQCKKVSNATISDDVAIKCDNLPSAPTT